MQNQHEELMNVRAELEAITQGLAAVDAQMKQYDVLYTEAVRSLERLEESDAPAAVDAIVANLQEQLLDHAILTSNELDFASKSLEREIEREVQEEAIENEPETE